jgi:tripeptidyl-peptidase I
VQQIFGINNPKVKVSVEANLDVQYIMSIGAFVNTSDYSSQFSVRILDAFLNYVTLVNSQNQPPLVHSISFGQYGGHYNNETVQRIDAEFQKMGARGITVLVASGDNGVGCNAACTSEEFDFPSSPWITLVGATYLDPDTNTEIGANFSSGGFSRDQWMPSYQQSAVNAYLNSGVPLPPASFYNRNGRAYPDVASIGQNIEIVVDGKDRQVAGTSCAAPIWGGIISLLNNDRLFQGKKPLGFVNPLFYQNPSVFTDTLKGVNPYECCQGFECAPGWDPVTGLGTPIFPKLLDLTSNLP